VGSYHKE